MLIVVAIFVVVKFNEGAWLVVILFATGPPSSAQPEYGRSPGPERISDRPGPPAAPKNFPRRTVFVLVDSFDLTLAALRCARSRPTTLRAVHFVVDTRQADTRPRGGPGGPTWSSIIDCPDRMPGWPNILSARARRSPERRSRWCCRAQLPPLLGHC